MIEITIGKKKYKGVYNWKDITLRQFCNLAAIPMPEGYEAYIIADGKFSLDTIEQYNAEVSKVTDHQLNIDFPAYYRKVIGCLTNIPDNIQVPQERAFEIYDWYFKPFVVSLIYHTPLVSIAGELQQYEAERIREFSIGLQTFYLPLTVRIMDQDVPLANESILAYTEACDVFKGMKLSREDISRLALFMAIYCRKKREEYDQKIVLERKDLFMKAPMSVVWAVFFCTMRRLPDSITATLLYTSLPRTMKEIVSKVRDCHVLDQEA